MKKITAVVQGSLNCDIVASGRALPLVGETVTGEHFGMYSGGKGGNQAVQLARLGAEVYFVGRVGCDSYGDFLLAELQKAGVHTEYILREDAQTGLGIVQCDARGQCYSMVIPGANGQCRAQDVAAARDVIGQADVLVCQLETTAGAMCAAVDTAHACGVPVILNPAPASGVDEAVFAKVHTVTPNETETAFYTGLDVQALSTPQGRDLAAQRMRARGVRRLVVTLGDKGCFYADAARQQLLPTVAIDAVDTTGAGDAFNGAYAYAVACGLELEACLKYGLAAGTVAAGARGAQPSMGDAAAIEALLKKL